MLGGPVTDDGLDLDDTGLVSYLLGLDGGLAETLKVDSGLVDRLCVPAEGSIPSKIII